MSLVEGRGGREEKRSDKLSRISESTRLLRGYMHRICVYLVEAEMCVR